MRVTRAILFLSCAVLLTGCAGAPVMTTTQTGSVPGVALRGRVHGGQTPIQGAHVYLYQINQSGWGAAATSLLTTGSGTDSYGTYVTTDMNGAWSLTGNYTCSNTSPYVYVLVIGGGPPGTGTNNPNLGLAAPLGPCVYATLISYTNIIVNEVSTVAAAYAFAAYATDATHAATGTSNLAATGLQNAFQNFLNLESISSMLTTGTANATTSGGYGTVPAATINTLANILAACINSASPFTNCNTLFSNATSNGAVNGTAPTETVTAAINIAHNPGANIAALFPLQAAAGAPFLPDLSSAPNDFTLAITYTNGGLNSPQSVAVDASGNVWVANGANDTISEFGPTIASGYSPISSSSGYTGAVEPWGIAIDNSGNVWASNASGGAGGNSLSEFSSTGSFIASYPNGNSIGASGLDFPRGVAIDQSGNIWIANSESSELTEFIPGSNVFSAFDGGGLSFSSGIAVDTANDIWVANGGNSSISEFNSSGAALNGSPITTGSLDFPFGVAVDAAGNIWASNSSNSLSEFNSSGTANGSDPFTGGGLGGPKGIAIDGSGNIWIADATSGVISEFSSSGAAISPANGYGYCTFCISSMGLPFGVAIDGSGDVWMTGYSYGTLTEFVGAATPVVTPIVANLMTSDGYGSSAVNRPN